MIDEHEAEWRREFDQWGYTAVSNLVYRLSGLDEPRRQAAFRWLREMEELRDIQQQKMQSDTRRTLLISIMILVVAVLGLIVSAIGLLR